MTRSRPEAPASSTAVGPGRRERYYVAGAFVVEHRPAQARLDRAVLLLPPMGYEDICAHRPLRVLAAALAEQGLTVLHLDWPGLGDSDLDDTAPDLPERWRRAVAGAVGLLRARGVARVAAVGVRAGALLALASPDIDELVLWAVPAHGKAYLREERAFEKMSAPSLGKPFDAPKPPEGVVEAAGFSYRPSTVRGLEGLKAAELAARPRARVLLIERDDGVPAGALLDALRAAGTPVTIGPATGLGDLLERPYKADLHPAVRDAILGWLAAPDGPGRPAPEAAPVVAGQRPPGMSPDVPETRSAELAVSGSEVVERPWVAPGGVGELSGIVCAPPGGVRPGQEWTIFFNAGGMRRCGPNRLWTTAARALAARGRPSLRFDVRDVGDSDGTAIPLRDLDGMYSEASIGDALTAWDWVSGQAPASVDVVGLCSGAFLGMQVAARRRVRRALLFNGLAYVWNEEARASDMTSEVGRSLLDGRRWRRLLTGRIDRRALARSLATKARLRAQDLLRRARGEPQLDAVRALIEGVAQRGTALHLVSSDGDPSIAYLEAHTTPEARPRLTILPGVDHTIRPVWAHARVIELVMEMTCPTPPKTGSS